MNAFQENIQPSPPPLQPVMDVYLLGDDVLHVPGGSTRQTGHITVHIRHRREN